LKRILFVCVENAGRSQIAEGFAKHYGKEKEVEAFSAGTMPSSEINPLVIQVMQEKGVGILKIDSLRLSCFVSHFRSILM
jgi:arsenate reductase